MIGSTLTRRRGLYSLRSHNTPKVISSTILGAKPQSEHRERLLPSLLGSQEPLKRDERSESKLVGAMGTNKGSAALLQRCLKPLNNYVRFSIRICGWYDSLTREGVRKPLNNNVRFLQGCGLGYLARLSMPFNTSSSILVIPSSERPSRSPISPSSFLMFRIP